MKNKNAFVFKISKFFQFGERVYDISKKVRRNSPLSLDLHNHFFTPLSRLFLSRESLRLNKS